MPTNAPQLTFSPLAKPPTTKDLQKFQQDAGWSVPTKETEKLLTANRKVQWVNVKADNATIGIARLELAPPEFCYLTDLIIKSKFRGQGVGRWFVNNIETFCLSLGIPRLLVFPEAGSQPFYDALSFIPDPLVPGILKKEISPLQRKKYFIPGNTQP